MEGHSNVGFEQQWSQWGNLGVIYFLSEIDEPELGLNTYELNFGPFHSRLKDPATWPDNPRRIDSVSAYNYGIIETKMEGFDFKIDVKSYGVDPETPLFHHNFSIPLPEQGMKKMPCNGIMNALLGQFSNLNR